MRVLLVGGTGYVGGHVLTALRAEGHDVTVLSRSAARASLPEGVVAAAGDVRDPESLRQALASGFDAVVHAVGLIRDRRTQGQTFQRVVAEGTGNLVAAAKSAGVSRFVLISANGTSPDGTPYQRSKWAAEEAVRGSGLAVTIFRPSIVYGPDDDFTNKFRRLMRLGALPYFGRGDYALAPVHADDLARAVARSLARPDAEGRIFHVCGPEVVSYRRMLQLIKAASGSRALLLPMPKFMIRIAALLLGWVPFFPATNAQLTMLFAGNTCPEDEWVRVFGVEAVPFSQGIRTYLGGPGSP